MRIDKWLWAVRVFKTRTLAVTACHLGRVLILDQPVKASREVRVGDVLVVKKDNMVRTYKVLQLLENRVGAAVVKDYLEDQTPASEFEKAREVRSASAFYRPKGAGRPTKKDRRALNDILESS